MENHGGDTTGVENIIILFFFFYSTPIVSPPWFSIQKWTKTGVTLHFLLVLQPKWNPHVRFHSKCNETHCDYWFRALLHADSRAHGGFGWPTALGHATFQFAFCLLYKIGTGTCVCSRHCQDKMLYTDVFPINKNKKTIGPLFRFGPPHVRLAKSTVFEL